MLFRSLKILVQGAYKQYEAWIDTVSYAVSATHIFESAVAPVFLDWCHVNARGNEIIADFIFEELKRREVIAN